MIIKLQDYQSRNDLHDVQTGLYMCTIKVVTDKCAEAGSHLTHPEFQPKYHIPCRPGEHYGCLWLFLLCVSSNKTGELVLLVMT